MARDYTAMRFRDRSGALTLNTAALEKYNDIIDLSIGDVDHVTDSRIIKAAFDDASRGYTHYGAPHGDKDLLRAVCDSWKEDYGQDITPDEVLITASACMGLAQILVAICDPGDEVMLLSPYFTLYRQQIALAGGKAVEIPTYPEDGYAPRMDLLEQAVTPRTKAIIINNPTNPTGKVYNREELMVLADFAKKHDLLVIADEVYTCYVFNGEYVPMRTLPDMADRTVTVCSFSKNFFMTGWRIGFFIARPELVQAAIAVAGMLIYSAPSISQRAAIKALELRKEIQANDAKLFRERVLYASERMSKLPYIDLVKPNGSFYLFPGAKDKSVTSKQFCDSLLEQAHILVSPGAVFGATGQGHVRFACTVEVDVLKEAFDRMERIEKL
ncbi:MAG: aminotransferase class I/II-fold pyridoxal phosphate-dependent enzyme [Clostridia bacterium]|nr:aminotransferase class I/II-fold pyridoxal phosphate-dependent enzyme [Clostridia bacterium]